MASDDLWGIATTHRSRAPLAMVKCEVRAMTDWLAADQLALGHQWYTAKPSRPGGIQEDSVRKTSQLGDTLMNYELNYP